MEKYNLINNKLRKKAENFKKIIIEWFDENDVYYQNVTLEENPVLIDDKNIFNRQFFLKIFFLYNYRGMVDYTLKNANKIFSNLKTTEYAFGFKRLNQRFDKVTILINLDENDKRVIKLQKIIDNE